MKKTIKMVFKDYKAKSPKALASLQSVALGRSLNQHGWTILHINNFGDQITMMKGNFRAYLTSNSSSAISQRNTAWGQDEPSKEGKMKKSLFQFITIIPLALLLCLSFSCQKQMTEEEMKAHVERELEIFNAGNLALVDELYSPEYVSHNYVTNEEQVGLDALKEGFTSMRTTFPDINVTYDEIIIMGDKTVTRWTMTGTNTGPLQTLEGELPPTGKKVRFSGVTISRRVNEKIAEEWIYFNVLDMVIQLGWTITPPQPPEPPEEKK